ncbi:MAG: hypothetical protein KAI43_04665 [Candidatus Aureabacteria bacterium]|nr:hypothetical protein [Candidatus Auribacterota bacterium]
MIKSPIAIRVDGSFKRGMGHIVRMLSIARELSDNQIPSIFIMKPFKEGYNIIQKAGFPIYLINEDYDESIDGIDLIKRILSDAGSKIIINDVQGTSHNYMISLKRYGYFTINIDDIGKGARLADVLIDAFIPQDKTCEKLYRFFGMDYLILRDEFFKNRPSTLRPDVKKICVMPGGTNAGKMMEKVIGWLSSLNKQYELYVMTGAGVDNDSAIYSDHNNSVIMVSDWNGVPDILADCDLSIASGGISMCESCTVGIPTIAIAQVKHELNNINLLSSKQAVFSMGYIKDLKKEVFLEAFKRIEKSYEYRSILAEKGKKAVDGKGKERIINIIKRFYQDICTSKDMLLKIAVN